MSNSAEPVEYRVTVTTNVGGRWMIQADGVMTGQGSPIWRTLRDPGAISDALRRAVAAVPLMDSKTKIEAAKPEGGRS